MKSAQEEWARENRPTHWYSQAHGVLWKHFFCGLSAKPWQKMKHRRFLLSPRKYFFTERVTENWHRMTREAVKSPSSMIFKSCLDTVLANWPYLSRDVGPDVPSSLHHSVIIWLQFLPPCTFHRLSIPSLKAVTTQHY